MFFLSLVHSPRTVPVYQSLSFKLNYRRTNRRFSRVMEKRKDYIHKYWQKDKAWKDRFRNNHNLHQEFEANGRRYYVVFVVSKWDSEYNLEESFRDPSLSWEGPFPGGQDLWPQALHRPAQVAYEIQQGGDINMWTDPHGSCILSWEPI